MVIHGARRRPRALLEELPKDVVAKIGDLFGSYREISYNESVDESEFDLLVTTVEAHRRAGLHVLILGGHGAGQVRLDEPVKVSMRPGQVPAPRTDVLILRRDDVLSEQLAIPIEVQGQTHDLVERSVVPVLAAIEPGERPQWVIASSVEWERPSTRAAGIQPLLTTHDPRKVLAFHARRAASSSVAGGVVVALPVMPNEVEDWVRWFLERAREVDPDAFPLDVAWHDDPAWTPVALRSALDRQAALAEELRAALDGFTRRQVALDDAVAAEREVAATGSWRLVTEQGAPLVEAVATALTALGFVVTDSDEGRPENDPKMEDLQAVDPDEAGWTALIEAKGFTKGASPKGGTQLVGRPVRAYVEANGRFPEAVWYVVNHLIETPPDQRPIALEHDSITGVLEESAGALIDTRDLLRAVLDVEAGTAEASAVRASLRAARGRWTWSTGHGPTAA